MVHEMERPHQWCNIGIDWYVTDGSVVIIVTGGCVGGVSSPMECRKSLVVAVLCWHREVVFTVIHHNVDVEVFIMVESRFSTEVAVLAPVAVSAPRVAVPEVAVLAMWDVSWCHVCHVLS